MPADSAKSVDHVLAALAEPAGQADPYPIYRQLHDLGPAAEASNGTLVVSGYRLASTLMREHRMEKRPERGLTESGFPDWGARPALRLLFSSMLVLNPPDHTRLRRLVSGAFTARRVAGLRSSIEQIVAELVDDLRGRESVDFVEAFAFPLPVTVIGELLGIPKADRPQFQPLVRDFTQVLNQLDEPTVAKADIAALEIEEYLRDVVAQRRACPRDDLLSALAAPNDGASGLSDDELVTMAALLFAAGFETTTGLLANGLLALLENPDQAALLRDDPGMSATATEEILRYDSPVQLLTARTAVADIGTADHDVAEGQRVITLLGAANRDPEIFDDPDVLRLNRDGQPPLSFGGGLHYCLGAPLARLEGQVAFPALLRAFPAMVRSGPVVPRMGLALHGVTELPIDTGGTPRTTPDATG